MITSETAPEIKLEFFLPLTAIWMEPPPFSFFFSPYSLLFLSPRLRNKSSFLHSSLKRLHSICLIQITSQYVVVNENCADLYKSGSKISGVYEINPDGLGEFEVYCDQKTAGGGWTVFQKRRDGFVDFYRSWNDYKRGFGNLSREFWLGLDKINRLTASGSYKLRVDLEDVQGKTAFAEYSSFAVTSERTKYRLSLGNYSGTSFYHTSVCDFPPKISNMKESTSLTHLMYQAFLKSWCSGCMQPRSRVQLNVVGRS